MEQVAQRVTGGLDIIAQTRGTDPRTMVQVIQRQTTPNSPNQTELGVILTAYQFRPFGDTLLDASDGEVLDMRIRTEHLEQRLDRISGAAANAASPALKDNQRQLNETEADLDNFRHGVQQSFVKSPLKDLLDTLGDDEEIVLYEEELSVLVDETEKQYDDWVSMEDKYDEAYIVVHDGFEEDNNVFLSPDPQLSRAWSLDDVSSVFSSSLLAATQPESPDNSAGMIAIVPGQCRLSRSRSMGRLHYDVEELYRNAASAALPRSPSPSDTEGASASTSASEGASAQTSASEGALAQTSASEGASAQTSASSSAEGASAPVSASEGATATTSASSIPFDVSNDTTVSASQVAEELDRTAEKYVNSKPARGLKRPRLSDTVQPSPNKSGSDRKKKTTKVNSSGKKTSRKFGNN